MGKEVIDMINISSRKKIVLVFLIAFTCILSSLSMVYGNDKLSEPELTTIISTDKEYYKIGDEITYFITITNRTNYIARNINISYEISSSIDVYEENLDKKVDKLMINESRNYTIKGRIVNNQDITITANVDNSNTTINSAKTEDNSSVEYMIVILTSSLILLVLMSKSNNKKKFISSIIVFSLAANIIGPSINYIDAKEIGYEGVKKNNQISTPINNSSEIFKLIYSVDFCSQGDGIINLDQVLEDDIYISSESLINLSGKASDPDGIEEIRYYIDDMSGKINQGNVKGTRNWSLEYEFESGTSLVQLIMSDKLGNETSLIFKVAKVSDEVELSKKTYVLSNNEILEFENAYIDCVLYGLDTQDDSTDDGLYVVLDRNAEFSKRIESSSSSPNVGDILYTEPSKELASGFVGKIIDIILPSENEFERVYTQVNSENVFTDDGYIVVKFATPSYDELIDDDYLVYVENGILEPENVLFFNLPNGQNILDESSKNTRNSNTYSNKSSNSYLLDFMPNVKISNDEISLAYDNTLFDGDGDTDTKADQLNFKASIKLSNFSVSKGVIEYKAEDLIPREMGFSVNYDTNIESQLTVGGTIDTTDFVKRLNTLHQGAQGTAGLDKLNKVSFFGNYQVAGVKMDKEIYLGCIGIQLGTGITTVGSFGDQQRRSAAPIVMVSLVIDLDGKLKAEASVSANYSSYNVNSFKMEKKDFKGILGKLELAGTVASGNILNLYDYKCNAEYYKSKDDKNSKPQLIHSYKLDGNFNTGIGVGVSIGLMIFGIQPATVGVSVGAEINGDANIKLDYINGEPQGNVEIDGKLGLKAGVYAKCALRLMLEKSKSNKKFGFDFYKKWWLHPLFVDKEFEFSNKTDVKINIYNNESDKVLVNEPGYTLYLNKGNDKFTHDLSTGICSFKDITYDDYHISIIDNDGNEIYNNIFTIDKEQNELDIYLTNYIPDDSSNNDFILEVGKTYRIECVQTKRLNSFNKTDTVTEGYYKDGAFRGSYIDAKNDKNIASYRPMDKGDFIDIKVYSGELSIYALKDGFDAFEGERDDFSKYFKITELNHDPLKKIELNPGSSITLDYQYIGTKGTSIYYSFNGNGLSGTQKKIDYYWNKRFGWDIRESEQTIREKETFWTTVGEGCSHTYIINSGNAKLYMGYEDAQKLVISS